MRTRYNAGGAAGLSDTLPVARGGKMAVYYPLAVGNAWKYRQADGSEFTNRVTAEDRSVPGRFTMVNSVLGTDQYMRKEGSSYLTDSFEKGNFHVLLRDDLSAGDTWDVRFTANTIESIVTMTVKEKGKSVEVNGRKYDDVLFVEAESKMVFNGNVMPLNFFTQYYYAPGTGLVLSTATGGTSISLISAELV